jgi:hypothetical protein
MKKLTFTNTHEAPVVGLGLGLGLGFGTHVHVGTSNIKANEAIHGATTIVVRA